VLEGAGADTDIGTACTVSSAATVATLPTVWSASEIRSEEAEVDAGCGSARANSRNSRSRRTRGDSSEMPHDGSVPGGSGVKDASLTPRVRATVAAGVEEIAACAGMKEVSDGVRSGLNVSPLNPDATDKSSGRGDVRGSPIAGPDEVSCRVDRSS
jgi:hypothetical protein